MKNRAVFLDRDGTILRERGYLSDSKKLKFYPGAFRALALLKKAGFKLILISNQSGVGRGFFTEQTVRKIHAALQKKLGNHQARLDGIYYCPHLPTSGCACRKPGAGLALKAARRFNIDFKKSFVVGDQKRDIQLAVNIGAQGVLVLTGAGRTVERNKLGKKVKITRNLKTAAHWVCRESRHSRESGNPCRQPVVGRNGFPIGTFGNDGRFATVPHWIVAHE